MDGWMDGFVCYVTTVAMVMLLRDFGPYGIIVMTELSSLDFPVISFR
jgi:hypothetical protein